MYQHQEQMALNSAIKPMISPLFAKIVSSSVTLLLLLCGGCQPEAPRKLASNTTSIQKIEFNGYMIPLFSTAAEQLGYTRSRIADINEKEAALELVLNRFAQDTHTCALARLDLAYLILGVDYRLADPDACRRALAQYHQITRTYTGLPGVCAKAYWYMGWIYTDLLSDKNRGLAMYRQVIDRYASELITIESPVPWLRFVYPQRIEKTVSTHKRQHYTWANLALLEVVKTNDDPTQCHSALMTLWSRKPTGPAFGLALLSALQADNFNNDETVAHIAREYIQQNSTNRALIRDIKAVLAQSGRENPTK